MAGAACTAVRAAEVGSALERERGRAVVGAADAMRVPLRVQQRQSQCAGALCRGARGGTIYRAGAASTCVRTLKTKIVLSSVI